MRTSRHRTERPQAESPDWQIQPLQGDFGDLLSGEKPLADLHSYAAAIFDAYVTGRDASGWFGGLRVVRLPYAAAVDMTDAFPFVLTQLVAREDQAWSAELLGLGDEGSRRTTLEKRGLIYALADAIGTLPN